MAEIQLAEYREIEAYPENSETRRIRLTPEWRTDKGECYWLEKTNPFRVSLSQRRKPSDRVLRTRPGTVNATVKNEPIQVNTSLRILARWRSNGHEMTAQTAGKVREALFPKRKPKGAKVIAVQFRSQEGGAA